MENCQGNEMAKSGRDDVWGVSIAMPCCPSPIVFISLSVSKVNRCGADVQVVSCHHCLVVFHHDGTVSVTIQKGM